VHRSSLPTIPGFPRVKERAEQLVGKARDAVPEGTFAVGGGLMITAVTTYVFLIVANQALPNKPYAALNTFWAFIFVAGPGLFLPLEQEVGRAVAHRRAQGLGGGPLVHKAARLAGLLTAAMVVLAIALAPLYVEGAFHSDAVVVAALAIGLVGFAFMHLTRGTLAGNGRFKPYGIILAIDGAAKLVAALVLWSLGVDNAGAYAMCIALSPFVATGIALIGQHGLLEDGPDAPYSELSKSLGWLLAGSLLMQTLGYSVLLGVGVLKGSASPKLVRALNSAFFVARVPPLLFQAVQGTLLPKLAGLAGAGRHDDFRSGFKQLMYIVCGIAALGTAAAFVIGVPLGKILFPPFDISSVDLGLLVAGNGMFIIALTIAQALIALHGHKAAAVAWGIGVVVFVAVAAVIPELDLRVELGFLIGTIATTAAMGWALNVRMRRGVDEGIGTLITQIEHEPLEL
jgi:O-antigen/teichoic acid export membrane protein